MGECSEELRRRWSCWSSRDIYTRKRTLFMSCQHCRCCIKINEPPLANQVSRWGGSGRRRSGMGSWRSSRRQGRRVALLKHAAVQGGRIPWLGLLKSFLLALPVLPVRALPPCSAATSTLFSPHQRSSGKWRSAEDCSAATWWPNWYLWPVDYPFISDLLEWSRQGMRRNSKPFRVFGSQKWCVFFPPPPFSVEFLSSVSQEEENPETN